jgi:hypothetical protein
MGIACYGKGESLDQLGLHEDAIKKYRKTIELDLTSAHLDKRKK